MALGFLGKAKKMMRGSGAIEPPKPQYYQVACREGHVIRGERTEGYQALRCPHCGDGVFVLPRSPLPLPTPPASARAKPRPVRAELAFTDDMGIELTDAPPQEELDEILWVDPEPARPSPVRSQVAPGPARPRPEPAPEPEPDPVVDTDFDIPFDPPPEQEPQIVPARPKAKARPKEAAPSARESATAARPTTSRPVQVEPGLIVVPTKPRRGGRLVLVLGAVGLIAAITVFLVMQKAKWDRLPHEAEVNFNEGKEALEAGRFEEAKQKLGRAAKAYTQLGARTEEAVEAIRLADEAAILNDLDLDTLKQIVEEVARLDEAEGQAKFKAFHKGRTILVEDVVGTMKDGRVQLRGLILVGRGPAPSKIGRLDLSDLELVKDKGFKPDEPLPIFGAKLDSIRLEGREWWISLEPKSGVWMTNAKALAIGFQEAPPS
jgi:DNA-directed RNA polymerase subunit RPC12/RpoP